MLRRVDIVRTDDSEERTAPPISVTAVCLVTANVVPSSAILVTLMMEATRSSETSVLTTAAGRNIPEDDILHSHCCGHLKSYIGIFLIYDRSMETEEYIDTTKATSDIPYFKQVFL
jgi:hypothetical protein